MIAIANCSENWAIGKNGKLLCTIPEDIQRFRDLTMGKTVIMGHNTLRSLPGGLPLPGRHNIVLLGTHSKIETNSINEPLPPNTSLTLTHSVHKALWYIENVPSEDVFVIGGGQIYEAFLPYCDKCLITLNSADADSADTFFPNLDEMPEWRLTEQSEAKCVNDGIIYEFLTYERIKG